MCDAVCVCDGCDAVCVCADADACVDDGDTTLRGGCDDDDAADAAACVDGADTTPLADDDDAIDVELATLRSVRIVRIAGIAFASLLCLCACCLFALYVSYAFVTVLISFFAVVYPASTAMGAPVGANMYVVGNIIIGNN